MSYACPKCAVQLGDPVDTCPNCGAKTKAAQYVKLPQIRRLSGKLQAVGTVLVAVSIIALLMGGWWGAALIFPGMVIFIAGRLL